MPAHRITALPTSTQAHPWTWGNKLLGYDAQRKRVWVLGQRVHHGSVGVLLSFIGAILAWHDRRDYSFWFVRGIGD